MHSIFVSLIGVVIAGYGFYYSSMIIGRCKGDDYHIAAMLCAWRRGDLIVVDLKSTLLEQPEQPQECSPASLAFRAFWYGRIV